MTNIVKGLQSVAGGDFGVMVLRKEGVVDELVREDSLRTLAASNTILALVLIGVLVLQTGQWYAEKREGAERKEWAEKEARDAKEGKSQRRMSSSGRKL